MNKTLLQEIRARDAQWTESTNPAFEAHRDRRALLLEITELEQSLGKAQSGPHEPSATEARAMARYWEGYADLIDAETAGHQLGTSTPV